MLLLLALLAAGCAPRPEQQATALLARYFSALQSGESAEVVRLLADCRSGRDCETELAGIRASVSAQRELDAYSFEDPWGVGLSRALVLGAGGYWRLDGLGPSEDGLRTARLTVLTHYRAEETRGLPRGAVIEFQVAPLGSVKRLERRGKGPGALRQQLAEVAIEAQLALTEEGWRVKSLRPLPETAVFESVSWWPR